MAFNEKELEIIKYGLVNGKSKEDVTKALTRYRTGDVPKAQEPVADSDSTFMDRASGVIGEAGKDVEGIITDNSKSPLTRGLEATARGFRAIPEIAVAALPEEGRQIVDVAGEAIGGGFKWLTDKISDDVVIKGLASWAESNPDKAKILDDALQSASAGGEIAGTILGVAQPTAAAQSAASKAKLAIGQKLEEASAITSRANSRLGAAIDSPIEQAKVALARKNVAPTVETSAARVKSPTAAYDKYVEQAKVALGDIKKDAPISEVGQKIGKSFEKVIAERRAAGKTMSEEMKLHGSSKADITDAFTNFEELLNESGVRYNAQTGKMGVLKTSKMVAEDARMLGDYAKELNRLGANPTLAEIDGFLGRTKSFIDNYKAKQGITGMTNAERLITGNRASLVKQLSAENNPALSKYAAARSRYADLSGFIDEGSGYLGKVTQSGDFAKDASIAKSSVQSILNNGKKDWLVRLEELTGYNALDDASIALQAMKDAGDFKGLSLLQAMQEGSTPISRTGITQKILDYALEKGGRALVGSPEDQTRALLQSLEKSQTTPMAARTPSPVNASAGETASSIKKSNTRIIPKSVAPRAKRATK